MLRPQFSVHANTENDNVWMFHFKIIVKETTFIPNVQINAYLVSWQKLLHLLD